MMTFQELTDKIGSEQIYTGTSVDSATQGALLEWLFDRYLSMSGDDTTTWLRRYRRNINMFYPIYLDYLRVESVRSNMDPFITDFMERVHDDNGTSVTSGTKAHNSSENSTGGTTTITDNLGVRTPDLTTAGTASHNQQDNGSGTQNVQGSDTRSNSSQDNSTDNSKSRNIAIGYPEANLGGISDSVDGFPSSIDYATADALTVGRNIHDGNSSSSESGSNTQNTSSTNSNTTQANDVNNVRETGTDRNKFDGTVKATNTGSKTGQGSETNSGTVTDQRKIEETDQGRHESPADILPRAISAITSTNSIKWLVNSLQLCFDNYCEI